MILNHTYHKDVKFVSVNTCPERNFYCPKTLKDKADVYKNGSRFISLNGEYEFAYYKKEEAFKENKKYSKISVPACWQSFNYGNGGYVNDKYWIPFNPPEVPDSDFGVYRKIISVSKKKDKKYYINFEGKDSCLYLYINKKFIGYDSISHCTSEFDITDALENGENEILIFVYVSCVGTYLECQDKFRLSGLFRDVYILERELEHIHSYKIKYEKISNNQIEVKITFNSPKISKNIELFDKNIKVLEYSTSTSEIKFVVQNPKLWNSEEPNLYLLKIVANNEVIYDYLAFRFINIEDGIIKLNGTKIKILGTNHHDSKYETGYYLSLKDYKNDLELLKEYHFNGIRTSHYPSAPEFMFLCDEYGMYVIDEADIECHGCVYKDGNYDLNNFDVITDDRTFEKHICERINRLVERDFNRPCVLFWSAGNEAGFGQVIIDCLKKLKQYDPSRLLHYESTYTGYPDRNNYKLDVISQMYPSIDKMKDTLKNDNRPLILCEYCHAMGNSCGDIHDYIEYFYSEDRIVGGFIWEFNDHLFPINGDKSKPGYGGDFNEISNSGNFCVDGMVTYKREPSTNMREIKEAYSRLRIIKKENKFYVANRNDFTTVKDLEIVIERDLSSKITIHVEELLPRTEAYIYELENESSLTFEIFKNDVSQHKISFLIKKDLVEPVISDGEIKDLNNLYLSNTHSTLAISKETGLVESIKVDGKQIVFGSDIDAMRAPLDNDQYEIYSWKEEGLFDYKVKLNKYNIYKNSLEVYLNCGKLGKGKITYSLNQYKIQISCDFDVNPEIKYLPRFSYTLKIDKKLNAYEYLGFGPFESYCDKFYLDTYGYFKDKVRKDILYVKPQETLSHLVTKLTVKNRQMDLIFKGMNSFSLLPYSKDMLMNTKHNYELTEDTDFNYLSLDYKMTGVGSHACGPELDSKYKLTEKKIVYSILMEVNNGNY